jgi:cytochrome o ubiquinol oxidase subunit 2
MSDSSTLSDHAERQKAYDHKHMVKRVCSYVVLVMLSGCTMQLMNPKGNIGEQEKTLIIVASALMLLVVIPVIVLTIFFAWRYRSTNLTAKYSPKWAHSTKIEAVVWSIPCVIVALLAFIIWGTTHDLDPYKPIESKVPPVRVEVVALNWKWLFIYPDYGIASVNQLQIPVDTPVEFKLTADSIMNAFFVPHLGSMVYVMPGMQTKLHLIANSTGSFGGMSASFSGPGFSDMKFNTVSSTRAEFEAWVARARQAKGRLDVSEYGALTAPSNGYPITLYGSLQPGIFRAIVDRYMVGNEKGDLCMTPSDQPAFQKVSLPSSATTQ